MQSLNQLLNRLHSQVLTPEQQQFQAVCNCWADVVGQTACQYTRPVVIHRGVLQVATSSSTWSQELTLRRMQILQKLNQRLELPLQNIRFATGQWREQPNRDQSVITPSPLDEIDQLWQKHPSRIPGGTEMKNCPQAASPTPASALTSFQHWAEMIKQRSQHLPECPHCHCPTPVGELERWSVCCLCSLKDLHSSEAPPKG